jgi:hypothetical protein
MVKLTLPKLFNIFASSLALSFFLVSNSYPQTEKIRYSDFLPLNYTANFKKSVHTNFEGTGKVDGEEISISIRLKQEVGVLSKFKNKQWTKVKTSVDGLAGDAAVNETLVALYDLKSKLQIYEIYVEDESVKKFEWNKIPSYLTLGQAVDAGSYTETDKDGKVISNAKILFLITKIKNGYEFCQIEYINNLETSESGTSEGCDLFSISKELTGSREKAKIGANIELSVVAGKIIIK